MILAEPIQKLIEAFSKLPGIGQRQARRIVFYLLSKKEAFINLVETAQKTKEKIAICKECFFPFEKTKTLTLCPICAHPKRNKKIICIVEKETDLLTIEETKKYFGLYHILGGLISPLEPKSYQNLRIKPLIERIKKYQVKEIILALPMTPQGETTALYLERVLKKYPLKITILGRGLPSGGEIEFADPQTIESALRHRESL